MQLARGGSVGPYQPNQFSRINPKSVWKFGSAIGKELKKAVDDRNKRQEQKSKKRSQPKSVSVGKQVEVAGGESRSSFYLVKKPKYTSAVRSTATQFKVNNEGIRSDASVGYQNSTLLGTYFDSTDIIAMYPVIFGGTVNQTTKLILCGVRAESLITNVATTNARISIYDVMLKKDSNASVVDPSQVFEAAFADTSGGVAGDYAVVGTTPYMNPRFMDFFKIKQRTEVILSPGATHSHVINYAPHRMISKTSTINTTGSIGGLTLFTMIIHHGSPANDSVTKTSVTLSKSSLDIVTKQVYSFKSIFYPLTGIATSNSLPTSYAVAGQAINEDGVVQTVTEA